MRRLATMMVAIVAGTLLGIGVSDAPITPALIETYKAKRLDEGVKKRTINIELSGLSAYVT